jgi:hypothetical protein
MMKLAICDIEADALPIEEVTKIHCISVGYQNPQDNKWKIKSTTNYDDMRKFFLKENQIIVMHYGTRYDIRVVEKILGIKIPKSSWILDTVPVSWTMYPYRPRHGLESWGEDFGVPKVEIAEEAWKDLDPKVAIERCEQDVRINIQLWVKVWTYMMEIYGSKDDALAYCRYLSFKMDCLRDQEEIGLTLDLEQVFKSMDFFLPQYEEKRKALEAVMPEVPVNKTKNRPKNLYKKDGSLSSLALKWIKFLEEEGADPERFEEIESLDFIDGYNPPNANSPDQIKNWLYELGWKPVTFEDRKNTKGEFNKVPQTTIGTRLCPSVERLLEQEPAIIELEGLGVIKHRLGLLKSFASVVSKPMFGLKYKDLSDAQIMEIREAAKSDQVFTFNADASSFTNTLRLQHVAPIANLPKVISKGKNKGGIKDGAYIRGVIKAPEGYTVCGSDMASLEDRVKQHFIYPYDPEYVKEMMVEGFDPHLDLAVMGKALTEEQAQAHKDGVEDHGAVRHNFKTGNYSCQYGAGAPKIAATLDISVAEGRRIHSVYWERNWAVKAVERDSLVKTVDGKMWLRNPINGFYYSLRNKKDIFSVLCQGGGTYIFDIWIYNMRARGYKPCHQYHDEVLVFILEDREEKRRLKKALKDSVNITNKQLKLLREMDVDVQFGNNYAEVH